MDRLRQISACWKTQSKRWVRVETTGLSDKFPRVTRRGRDMGEKKEPPAHRRSNRSGWSMPCPVCDQPPIWRPCPSDSAGPVQLDSHHFAYDYERTCVTCGAAIPW
eukprot:g70134.t1